MSSFSKIESLSFKSFILEISVDLDLFVKDKEFFAFMLLRLLLLVNN